MLAIMGFRYYYFSKYVNNYFKTEVLCIELVSINLNKENVFYKKSECINIRENITNILLWKSSETIFERGKGYSYLRLKITALEKRPLFLTMVLHHNKKALQITFSSEGYQISSVKHIESKEIIENLLSKFYEYY
jgi:hypothetical protein